MTQLPSKPPVQLLVGLRTGEPALIEELTGRLALEFGTIRARSPRFMEKHGSDTLTRQWITFDEPLDPVNFTSVKRHALRVEELYLDVRGAPRIRIDVAYLDPLRVVRATAVDAAHRVYLGSGIFGEVLLHWRVGEGFAAMPWTPAEDRSPRVLDFMTQAHADWMRAIRTGLE